MSSRIYVCHTLYHVYVTLLKELNMNPKDRHDADIALSSVFMDFEDLYERLEESQLFNRVLHLNEKRADDFKDIAKYKANQHNILKHMINRIIFTKKLGKLQDSFIDIEFKKYKDIYVYCDSDPIGYYLNYHHIKYHALEDGLDCLKNFDAAHYDNAGHFKLKAFMAGLNLIFIQNGYSKYCIDMEINDDSYIDYEFKKYKILPRKSLEAALSAKDKEIILKIFLPDADKLIKKLKGLNNCILFMTEAYPGGSQENDEIRKKVAEEVLRDYCDVDSHVLIKPHPRDDIDYESLYPMCNVIKGKFPIEVLNFIEGIHFTKAISIISSALDSIDFCSEKLNIGPHIYDKYEAKEKHQFMLEAWDKKHLTD